mgnify:CR=1 FL=1
MMADEKSLREFLMPLRNKLLRNEDYYADKTFDTLPEDAIFIRKEVFVKEQGFKNEFDEKDNEAHFLVGYKNDNPIATCRIFL